VQFHWRNAGYRTFDDFLSALSHDKRKKIRQERRRVRDAGISFSWLSGDEVSPDLWTFFARGYDDTYRRHLSTPYLNRAFFERIGRDLPGNVLLCIARRDGAPVAAALYLRNATRLYGRYWGAVGQYPGLHFEACYYQAIEYAIAHGLEAFEGGAQGEHKMARGLMPVETASAHWLAHPQFAAAVEDFLGRERAGVAHYIDELREHTPFRRADAPEAPPHS
jgi:predicted N-acyltransferase